MAILVEDFPSLLRILDDHPEWREELRRRLFDDEFLRLPEWVRQNSADIQALKEVVAQNGRDIQALRTTIAESRAEFEARFTRIEGDIGEIKADIGEMKSDIVKINGHLGSIDGSLFETQWRNGFTGRFSSLIYRARLITTRDLDAFETAYQNGEISDAEANAVRRLDLLIEGVRGKGSEREDILLAVEVSTTIEEQDIARAAERAAILRRAGYNALAVVAGSLMGARLRDLAIERGVEVVFGD
jgi:hypothetical protein